MKPLDPLEQLVYCSEVSLFIWTGEMSRFSSVWQIMCLLSHQSNAEFKTKAALGPDKHFNTLLLLFVLFVLSV